MPKPGEPGDSRHPAEPYFIVGRRGQAVNVLRAIVDISSVWDDDEAQRAAGATDMVAVAPGDSIPAQATAGPRLSLN